MLGSLFETRTVRDVARLSAWAAGDDDLSGNTSAGVNVSGGTAVRLMAVYACVRFRAEQISVLPVDVFRGGQEIGRPAWLDRPNPEMTFADWVAGQSASLDLAGNAFSAVVRNEFGQVVELWPVPVQSVVVDRDSSGRKRFVVDGQVFRGEMLHVPGIMLPGQVTGLDPVSACREQIGAGLVQQEFAARFFANGSSPSIVVESPQGPETIDAAKLRESFERFHRGSRRAHGVAVLTGGATAKPLTISPENAQFLETRNFSGAEIAAGMFGVPPDMVGYVLNGSATLTYQNIEQRWTELVRRCFMPTMGRLERALSGLLPRPQSVRFNSDAYLRADLKSRYEAAEIGIRSRFLTPNEARKFENLPPLSGGDEFVPSAPAVGGQ